MENRQTNKQIYEVRTRIKFTRTMNEFSKAHNVHCARHKKTFSNTTSSAGLTLPYLKMYFLTGLSSGICEYRNFCSTNYI